MIVCRYQESFDDTVVAALLAEVGPQDALLVLLPEAEAGRVAWLQARLGGLGSRLAGAVFPLLIYDEELVDRGVLFLILRHAPPPRLLGGVGDPREVAGVAANLTHQVEEALSPEQEASLFCIFDALVPNIHTLLDARSVAADTPARLVSALHELGEARDAGDMLMFYCAGRRMQKGEVGVRAELRAVRADSGATHLDGALSLGEIGGAASGGYPLFHNATLVGVPCRIR